MATPNDTVNSMKTKILHLFPISNIVKTTDVLRTPNIKHFSKKYINCAEILKFAIVKALINFSKK